MKPELVAPAGDMTMLSTAIESGADAIYFGVKTLNMRATAKNFEESMIEKVVKRCHAKGVKAYLTLNSIVLEDELLAMRRIIRIAKAASVDAIIAWDMAVIEEAKTQGIPIHLSTQGSVSNSKACNIYGKLGVKRIVLARECSLMDIKKIKERAKVELEVFIHGAMCLSISGRCLISEHLFGRSANRGDCIQPCRREYILKDPEEGSEISIENHFLLSPKDLCTIEFLDRIIDAGADALKIEGRGKDPDYVKATVSAYRDAIDACMEARFDPGRKAILKGQLGKAFNRGFSNGFYLGKPISDFTDSHGSKGHERKIFIGKIKKVYDKINVACLRIESHGISLGDHLQVQGPTTGTVDISLESIEIEHQKAAIAKTGEYAGIKVGRKVRPQDMVFLILEDKEVEKDQNA